jgi:dipeptidyl aminopeptidase/acylaminoacyl peptidase
MHRRALLLALSLGAGTFAQTAPAPEVSPVIPLRSFTRFEEFGGLKISPDGKSMALLAGNGRTTIAFIDVASNAVQYAIAAPEHFGIDEFHWISPTRLLVTINHRYSELMEPSPSGRAFAIERDGSKRQDLYCCTPIELYEMPVALPVSGNELLGSDGGRHLITASHNVRRGNLAREADPYMKARIYRQDSYTGSAEQIDIAPLRGARLLLDSAHRPRFALGLNQFSKPGLSWKQQPDSEWADVFLNELRNESAVPLRFSADDRTIFLRGVREGESLASLYRLDTASARYERVHAFANADVEDVITDFAEREIIGVRGYAERTVEHWLKPDDPTAQTYEALRRAFPGQRISLTSAASDGKTAIVLVDSDTNPGDYYQFDTVTRQAKFLRAARAWINPREMRAKEPIALKARDGLALHGYVTRPAGDGPYPLLVMPHDGPLGERDRWEFDWEVQLLASRGYAILQVNYRGSAGYGMDFERAGYGEWGAKVQDDIADATRWAIEQKIAAADRICIYGKVYGAYAALMGVAREPDLYRCAIGYDGVYDLELADTEDARWGDKAIERAFGSDEAQRRARSLTLHARTVKRAADYAKKIKAPVLLIYGEPGWHSDFQHARYMRLGLQKSGVQVEMMPVLRHDTQLYDETTRREVYERILKFLAASLRTPPPAAPAAPSGAGTP